MARTEVAVQDRSQRDHANTSITSHCLRTIGPSSASSCCVPDKQYLDKLNFIRILKCLSIIYFLFTLYLDHIPTLPSFPSFALTNPSLLCPLPFSAEKAEPRWVLPDPGTSIPGRTRHVLSSLTKSQPGSPDRGKGI